MATNAKIIKLGNGNFTYIPITSTEAIQHSYGSEKVVLESYLGGLQADIAKNATNISTLAGAVIQEKANLDARSLRSPRMHVNFTILTTVVPVTTLTSRCHGIGTRHHIQ